MEGKADSGVGAGGGMRVVKRGGGGGGGREKKRGRERTAERDRGGLEVEGGRHGERSVFEM